MPAAPPSQDARHAASMGRSETARMRPSPPSDEVASLVSKLPNVAHEDGLNVTIALAEPDVVGNRSSRVEDASEALQHAEPEDDDLLVVVLGEHGLLLSERPPTG